MLSESSKGKTVEEIESMIQNTINDQKACENNGDYIGAEDCQKKIEHLKKDFDHKRVK